MKVRPGCNTFLTHFRDEPERRHTQAAEVTLILCLHTHTEQQLTIITLIIQRP